MVGGWTEVLLTGVTLVCVGCRADEASSSEYTWMVVACISHAM